MSEYDALIGAFVEEAGELLDQLQDSLLELEQCPEDPECVDRVFRCLHTIKGCAAMFGFDEISSFAHDIENAYQDVRAGRLAVTPSLVDTTLRAGDTIRTVISDVAEHREVSVPQLELDTAGRYGAVSQQVDREAAGSRDGQLRRFRIEYRPSASGFASGLDIAPVIEQLRLVGRCRVLLHTEDVPAVDLLDPIECHVWWEIVIDTDGGEDAVHDALLFADDAHVSVEEMDADTSEFAAIAPATNATEEIVQAPLPSVAAASSGTASLRVSPAKLDELVDLVGELVTAQARLTEIASASDDPLIVPVAEDIERLTSSLRDSVLDIRMVPIGHLFGKYTRVVRDLSGQLGKRARLEVEGGETELDKGVIDRIADPLVHLVRNAVDHGLETPEDREAAGKPPVGRVRLAAYQSAGEVVIEVEDDGAGLNRDAILRCAVERGIVAEETELTSEQIAELLFAPGFSTAECVTRVSGRGVGLDAVRRVVEDLRGTLTIGDGRMGGTLSRIRIPLTLAIIEGLLVAVGPDRYIIPLDAVEECIDLVAHDTRGGGNVVDLRGKPVPYVRLRRCFDIAGEAPEHEIAVLARVLGEQVGFVVDNVVGQHQTVIKTLGAARADRVGVSGATILGDGTVALILDVIRLARDGDGARERDGGRGCV